MSYAIDFTDDADKCIAKCKKSNPTGTGHPKPLVKGSSIRYSRRISGKDRMIYDIFDDIVLVNIISVKGHYNDK
jgi:toxin YoeB